MLVSPVISLLEGFKSNSVVFKRWTLIAFITFYGSIISVSDFNDGYRHLKNVYDHYLDLEFSQFWSELIQILIFSPAPGTNDDVYIHLLSYLTGSILGLPGLFFVFVSFVYAYFYSGVLLKVVKLLPDVRYGWLFYAFATIFILWKGIEGVNTVRTWTGLWVLLYGALSYFETGKVKYLMLTLLPPFIHIAYFIMAIPVWFVIVFGSWRLIYVGIYVISFITTIDQNFALDNLRQTEVGEEKVRHYYVEENQAAGGSGQNQGRATWYRWFYKIGVQDWGITLITCTLILGGAYFRDMNSIEARIFSVGLLTKALANYGYFLFALSNRATLVSGLFILVVLVLLFARGYFQAVHFNRVRFQKLFLYCAFLFFIPLLVYKVADLIYFLSAFILLCPFIVWISPEWNLSIRELVGHLFS